MFLITQFLALLHPSKPSRESADAGKPKIPVRPGPGRPLFPGANGPKGLLEFLIN